MEFQVQANKDFKWQVFNRKKPGSVLEVKMNDVADVPEDLSEKDAIELIELGYCTYVEQDELDANDELDEQPDEEPVVEPEVKEKKAKKK